VHAAPGTSGLAVGVDLTDPQRLVAVRRLLAAAPVSEGIDRLTGLAAMLLRATYSQVSLLADTQVVASLAGRPLEPEASSGPLEDSLCTVTVRGGGPLVVSDAGADERVSALPPVRSGAVGAYLGVPLVDSAGMRLGALCVYDERPRRWTPADVGVLGELAASVVAELELQAVTSEMLTSVARLELVLSAADIGSFDLDLDTGTLLWDDRLLDLFGYTGAEFDRSIASFQARVHPEDRDRMSDVIARTVETGGDLSADYRIVRPGGEVRWVQARGRVLGRRAGRGGRLLGVAYDWTELRDTRDRLARVLETMTDAFYSLDRDWAFSYVNPEAERLLGRPREQLLGRNIWEEFPAAVGTAFQEAYDSAMQDGRPVDFEAYYPAPLDGWYEIRAWPQPDGIGVYFREVTDRHRAQEQRERAYRDREQAVVERERAYAAAEAANHRMTLLADASTQLSASLEPEQVLSTLADIVVPELGAWLAVAVAGEAAGPLLGEAAQDSRTVRIVHVAHSDPDRQPALASLLSRMTLSTDDPVGVGAVIATGEPEWLPRVTEDALQNFGWDEPTLAAARELRVGAALSVPLVSRGRRLGAITVAEPPVGEVDRALLVDLAGRAAVALDNALLYLSERRTGITLQRSLLPREVPELPGLQVAVRYLPGATGAFVGGDWYQVVPVGDALVLAMGDVMGHGMRSAARMGQLRAIVATLALEGHPPGVLLRRLSANVDALLDLELATLLVALYDPAGRTLTVASAGHPPPVHSPLQGEPRFVGVAPGPPLGTFAGAYPETVVDVAAGDTVVLYTDGLVENREEALDAGLERLRRAMRDVQLPPERVADHLLETMGRAAGGDDDVALLVLSHAEEVRS
jgi:PAS domain S-box-containing protein